LLPEGASATPALKNSAKTLSFATAAEPKPMAALDKAGTAASFEAFPLIAD